MRKFPLARLTKVRKCRYMTPKNENAVALTTANPQSNPTEPASQDYTANSDCVNGEVEKDASDPTSEGRWGIAPFNDLPGVDLDSETIEILERLAQEEEASRKRNPHAGSVERCARMNREHEALVEKMKGNHQWENFRDWCIDRWLKEYVYGRECTLRSEPEYAVWFEDYKARHPEEDRTVRNLLDIFYKRPRKGKGSKKQPLEIEPCPDDERNAWIFRAACQCVKAGLDDDEAREKIEEELTRPERPGEIAHALRSARGAKSSSSSRWPRRSEKLADKVCAEVSLKVGDLISRSPVPIRMDQAQQTEAWISWLFPGDPLLCAGPSNKAVVTATRKELRGQLGRFALIVPSPMSACEGFTKEGRSSPRSLLNTGPRRFLIVEFDHEPSLDRQASLMWRLASYWPLACVAFSGNKSLQGWFSTGGEPDTPGGKPAKFF